MKYGCNLTLIALPACKTGVGGTVFVVQNFTLFIHKIELQNLSHSQSSLNVLGPTDDRHVLQPAILHQYLAMADILFC